MGFLERARSQRGRHQRQRSAMLEEQMPQSTPITQLKRSATKTKRKSIFPGLSSNGISIPSESTRPRSKTLNSNYYEPAASRKEQEPVPPNMMYSFGNDSFKFPSPALVNENTKRTPPTSVAHLPSLIGSTSTISSQAPQKSAKAVPPNWGRSATLPIQTTTQREVPPKQANTAEDNQPKPQLKRQKSAWKTLGSLFKGKQARQPLPEQFYQAQPPSKVSLVRPDKTVEDRVGVLDSPAPSPIAKDEPTVARVDSGITEKSGNSLVPPTSVYSYPARSSSRKSENFFEPVPDTTAATATDAPRRTPKLDVSIPNAGLDRYSIMFEKLLEPKVPLLERRASKNVASKNISPITGPGTPRIQRSMTTSSLARAPSLTIHIAHSNRATRSSTTTDQYKGPMAHRPRPPKRSTTLPIPASPLSVPSEAPTPITARAVPLPESTTTASSPGCSYTSEDENSLPPTPNTATSLASSTSTAIFEIAAATAFSPPPRRPASIAAAEHSKSSLGSSNSSSSSPPPPIPSRSIERPQVLRNYPSGTERFNRQIVQVSVARQVSVSKARRRVAGAAEVKQPLRPQLMELGKNRKSTLVMIEGGD